MFQPPRGTRDFLPQEMIRRQFVLDTARSVFEKWGFDPLDTPAFEDYELLTAKAGDAIKDEIYYFKDKSDRELGLRFDLTTPMARVVASNPEIPKPFRRYQIGSVWRYDRPGQGRYREFAQADIDIVGTAGVDADAEVVACACEVLKKIGFSDFVVRVNNRKIINAFLDSLKTKTGEVMRTMDKLEKIGEEGVREELKSKNIEPHVIEKILKFVKTKNLSTLSGDGVAELEELIEKLKAFGINAKADMSMIRGLDYYTGNIFEICQEGNLTITAGGRYDNMIENFGGRPTPAVGISLGVDRLLNFVQLNLGKTKVDIYIAAVNDKVKKKSNETASELRDLGLNIECDISGRPLSKQFEYANSKGIKFVIVLGEKEIKSGVFKIRNMESGNEKDIEFRNMKRVLDIVKD